MHSPLGPDTRDLVWLWHGAVQHGAARHSAVGPMREQGYDKHRLMPDICAAFRSWVKTGTDDYPARRDRGITEGVLANQH